MLEKAMAPLFIGEERRRAICRFVPQGVINRPLWHWLNPFGEEVVVRAGMASFPSRPVPCFSLGLILRLRSFALTGMHNLLVEPAAHLTWARGLARGATG